MSATETLPTPSTPQSPPAKRGVGALVAAALKQRAFLATVVVLAVAAIGLNGATEMLKLSFRKQAVPLRADLATLPEMVGPWMQVSKDRPLEKDIEDVLGTDKYIFRDFIDTRIVPASRLAAFKDADWRKRQELLVGIQREFPSAVINLAVTYYTGMVDTVAHIPDRCYIADGYQPKEYTEPTWAIAGVNGNDGRNLKVRFINFEDQGARSKVSRSVTYFFHCNGEYKSDPVGVRLSLQDLFQSHGYYAKVELMMLTSDTTMAQQRKTDFLASALPEVERLLPDWQAVKGRQSPQAPAAASATGVR